MFFEVIPMARTPKKSIERPLTEVELEVMKPVWQMGECTIREVFDALPKDRELAYTTVATMIKILEQKGVIASRKKERPHTYYPLIQKSEYEALSFRHIADNLFEGDSASMVMRLLDHGDLTEDELKKIRQILEERMQK